MTEEWHEGYDDGFNDVQNGRAAAQSEDGISDRATLEDNEYIRGYLVGYSEGADSDNDGA